MVPRMVAGGRPQRLTIRLILERYTMLRFAAAGREMIVAAAGREMIVAGEWHRPDEPAEVDTT